MNYLNGIEKCIAFIEENLETDINVADVVTQEFYSYPHLHRVFTSIVGDSISNYIRKRRLTNAGKDLIMTEDAIVDIALKYSFSSQQTFTRAFQAYFNESPGKVRKNRRLNTMYNRFEMNEKFKNDLKQLDVSIEVLPAFNVVSYQKVVRNIKEATKEKQYDQLVSEVWNKLIMWQMTYEYQKKYGITDKLLTKTKLGRFMIENDLHTKSNTQYFGFENPFPHEEKEYGYETWIKLNEPDMEVIDKIDMDDFTMKKFKGGRYITADISNSQDTSLDQAWRYLHYYMSIHKEYQYGDHPWLEEHLTVKGEGGFHGFKLYLPIK